MDGAGWGELCPGLLALAMSAPVKEPQGLNLRIHRRARISGLPGHRIRLSLPPTTRRPSGRLPMKGIIAVVLVAGMPALAAAAEVELSEQQKLGWRLFETSCGVCHTRPTLIAGLYGPELNKESAGGREE